MSKMNNNPISDKVVYTPSEIKSLLGIGKNEVYKLIRTGEIKSIKVGRKLLVPKQSFYDWLNSKNS